MKRTIAILLIALFVLLSIGLTSAATAVSTRCTECRPTPTATFEERFTPTFTPDTGRITPTPNP